MTRTRVAALVMIPLAIIVGAVGGRLWHASHLSHVAERSAPRPVDRAPEQSAPLAPALSTRPATTPADQRGHDASPTVADMPKTRPTKSAATPSDGKTPSFDVVRVEPQGDAVVAGKGAPNAKVALLSGGKVVGEATSDANGQFVILPERLAPGDHALTLRQTPAGQQTRESTQSVAISVPRPNEGRNKVVVALAEPGKATKLLSSPPGASNAPAAAGPTDKVIIRSAELENGTGLYVSGASKPGVSVQVYLNESHIAAVVAGADGAWSVRVKHGLTGGHYTVRADAAGAGGKIASRAEVPFDVPEVMALAGKPPVALPESSAAPSSQTATGTLAPSAAAPHGADAQPKPAPARDVAATRNAAPAPSSSTTASPQQAAAPSDAPTTAGADAVIETVATARVTTGDNLWNISRYRLGDGLRYTQIYAANSDQIRDPNLIYPGQIFVVPNR